MSQQSSPASNFLIYVAGVPSAATKEELKGFFERFGLIKSVEMRLCRGENNRNGSVGSPPKVYWLLEAADHSTYKAVLNCYPCIFCDRKLFLAPFKSGVDLVMHNNSIAKKRVLVKKVPHWLPEIALIRAIEKGFGPVDTHFKFQSDSNHLQKLEDSTKMRKTHTFSVIFQHKPDRDAIVRAGQLQIARDLVVTVEKFMHTSELRKNKQQTRLTRIQFNQNGKKTRQKAGTSKAHQGANGSVKTLDDFSSPLSVVGPQFQAIDGRLQKYLEIPSSHHSAPPKPTQRIYYEQKQDSAVLTRLALSSASFGAEENIRFNLAPSPISRQHTTTVVRVQ